MAPEDEPAKEPWKFRTDFMRLRRYSFIPGYTGHCPTLRERFGETYATATCAANTIRRRSASMPAFEIADMSSTGTEDSSIMTEIVPLTRRGLEYPSYKPPPYLSQPPRPASVPLIFPASQCYCAGPCKGAASGRSCQQTARDEISASRSALELENHLLRLPRLIPICDHGNLVENIRRFNEERRHRPSRRHTFETPLIGYQGHIPRLRTTHVGLGMRFTEAARHSLHAFRQELEHERRYREKLREACYAI